MNLKTQNIIICGLFASITAVLSQISIPLPFTTVPLTMQIFAVSLTGLILGSKKGLISILIYLLLGAVLSQISIPLPFTTVPLTMQIFAVSLTGLILGSKKGLISILIYLLLGSIGLPVFAQMSGGLGILMGPTGGFLLGCPLMAFVVGYVSERSSSKLYILLSMVLGLSVVYITGTIMFSVVTKSTIQESILACVAVSERSSSKLYILLSMVLGLSVVYITGTIMFSVVTKSTIQESILACVAPFVVVDLIKLFLATSIGISISKRVNIGVKSC